MALGNPPSAATRSPRLLAFLAHQRQCRWYRRLVGSDRGRLLGAVELMDRADVDPGELSRTLADLAWINRRLGGTRLVLAHLAFLLSTQSTPIRILDVGTGYADVPRAVVRWARRRDLPIEIEAVDSHDQILELARHASRRYPEIHVRHADALNLAYPDGWFDVVLASLILHHTEGEAQVRLLRELYRVARHAVVVNDLRRGRWPFLATWASLRLLSRSRIIHHDGPLSVRRGFVPGELSALARLAGWVQARVSRHAFFRLALVGEKPTEKQPQMNANDCNAHPEKSEGS